MQPAPADQTAQPTVPFDELLDRFDSPSDSLETGSEVEPAAPVDALPGASPADVAALRAEIERMRQEAADRETNFNKRIADTQAWAQQANNGRQFAQELLRAQQTWADQQRLAAEQARAYAVPELTEEQEESLIADPKFLRQYWEVRDQATRNRVMAELAPRLANAEALATIAEPVVELLSEVARFRASQMAEVAGITEEEFDEYLPVAQQYLAQSVNNNPWNYQRLRLNPQAVALAVQAVRQQRPVPVKPSPKAPSLGPGDAKTAASRAPNPNAKSLAQLQVERDLGIKLAPEREAAAKDKLQQLVARRR